MQTLHWSLVKRLMTAMILTAGMSCSENTSDQSLNNDQLRWPAFSSAPGTGLKTIDFGPQQIRTAPGKILTDIVSHLPTSYGNTYYDSDVITWGHETSHGIHSHLRNNFNTTGRKANGFYLLNDKAAIVAEPKILKRRIAEFVPTALRGSRYGLYVTGQIAWDDTPLYIIDEFHAYVNGAEVALDLHAQNLWTYGNRDALEGMMEFVSYSLAVAMAVQKFDPEYFVTYTQFTEFLAFDIERAMHLFRNGSQIPEFKRGSQEQLFKILSTGDEAAHMREFALRLYGSEWVNRVLLAPINQPQDEQKNDLKDPHADADDDLDGIVNRLDKCPKSPAGQKVWNYGEWIGCAEGEERS